MKIAIAGIGYVGLSNAILLSQNNSVTLLDIDKSKVDLINSKKSPIAEKMIESYLTDRKLDLIATNDSSSAFLDKDFIIIATPTNFNRNCISISNGHSRFNNNRSFLIYQMSLLDN